MASSRIPAAKAALITALKARAALRTVAVTYAKPAQPPPEWMWVRAAKGRQRAAALGMQRREERWQQEVVISVVRKGRDVQKAGERAFALLAEIENTVRTDASLGDVVRWFQVGEIEYEEFQSENPVQVEGRVTAILEGAARI